MAAKTSNKQTASSSKQSAGGAKRGASSSASRSSASKKAAETRAANLERQRRQRESRGVVCIAIGVLLGAYLFVSGTGVLGEALSHLLFGLCGWPAYIVPVVCIMGGIAIIRGSRSDVGGSGWAVPVGVFSLLTLAQVIRNAPYAGEQYLPFLQAAYQDGVLYRRGGGAIGGIMCYPLQQLGGNVLAYTVTITLLIIVIIMLTRLSLRAVGARVGERVGESFETVRENVREADKRLYVVEMQKDDPDEVYDEPFLPPWKRKKRGELDDFNSAAEAIAPQSAKPPRVREAGQDLTYLTEAPLRTKPLKGAALPDEPEPATDTLTVRPVRTALETPPAAEPFAAPAAVNAFSGAPIAEPPKKRVKASVTESGAGSADVTVPDIAVEQPPAYMPPSFSLLNPPPASYGAGGENPNDVARLLVDTLASFNIAVKVLNFSVGPVITRFELQPAPGVRVSRITSLSNDIALALAAPRVRIEAPIPGKAAIGIEIPNKNAVTVVLRDVVDSREFKGAASPITMALGKDISGKVIVADLSKMPHMLIAGATGSGKSVCINDLIISMVYKSSPADLRMILVDPKMVELSVFGTLPHLLIPVVTDPKKAAGALRWAVNEMTQRYKKFSALGARDLARYNELVAPEERLPKLVVIIDELADLMMVAPDEVEDSICRIAQLGRASGIHLIVATQRPSADIITGLIKANIPSRCAFAVSSAIDSRIILDSAGAEKLLGRGDMLFHPNGAGKPTRLQCAFVSDEEVERVMEYFRAQQQPPAFDDKFVAEVTTAAKGGATGGVFGEGKQEDELLGEAVRIVLESGQASISMIQRRLRVGYARAARLVDMMEQHGFVSGFDGSKPRRVLIKRSEFEQLFGDGTVAGDDDAETGAATAGDDEPPFEPGDDL